MFTVNIPWAVRLDSEGGEGVVIAAFRAEEDVVVVFVALVVVLLEL